ncbi:hypothetical protein [Cetacean poxvirus 1]|nr:hypothetical protein [Cetacean poxvirus 1]QHG62689.1 hypothetical protein [Cetacean poxvirus 1]
MLPSSLKLSILASVSSAAACIVHFNKPTLSQLLGMIAAAASAAAAAQSARERYSNIVHLLGPCIRLAECELDDAVNDMIRCINDIVESENRGSSSYLSIGE